MPFIQTAVGLVLPDDWTRGDSNTVGNGWIEPLLSEAAEAMQILNNQLRCAIGVAGIGRSSPTLPNDMIMQLNIDMSSVVLFCKLGFRTDILAVGVGSEDGYGVVLKEATDQLLIQETVAGSGFTRDTQVFVPGGNNIFGFRAITEVSGADLIVRSGVTAVLTDLQDLTKTFDAVTGSFTFTSPVFTLGEYFIFSNTADLRADRFRLCGRNVVINTIPAGWKMSIDAGVTKVVESGGSVTFDVDTAALPRRDIRAFTPTDVQKDIIIQDIYGGDVFDFRVYPKDAMITGVSR